MDYYKLSITEASKLIHAQKLSPIKLLESLYKRIYKIEPQIEAFVTLNKEEAMFSAENMLKEVEEGRTRGLLHGIPIGIKDIYYTKNLRTTMGSPIFQDFIPKYDADTVSILRKEGAIIIGKTETTEFALTDPAPTRNPWNVEHTPGGSSSGSAAGVSSGMCPVALGSQTGGSVIRPASFCGVVGYKPTYDLVSRNGVFPLAWSLDHIGWFTRTVEDSKIMLEALKTKEKIQNELSEGLTIGVLRGYFEDESVDQVWEGFQSDINELSNYGYELSDVSLPPTFKLVHDAHRIVMSSETAAIHKNLLEKNKGNYRYNIRGFIKSGHLVDAVTYINALRLKKIFQEEIEKILKEVDYLVTPSAPTPAPYGLSSTGNMAFNAPWSFSGSPTITIPTGLTKNGLPLGLQIIGSRYSDRNLHNFAYDLEKVFKFSHIPRDPFQI